MLAPAPVRMLPEPLNDALDQVVAPMVLSMRPPVRSLTLAPLKLSAALVVVLPAPVMVPPVQVAGPLSVRLPDPLSVPPENVNGPLIVEGPARFRLPPDTTKASSTVNWFAAKAPDETVMVCTPATLTFTFCPAVGAAPVLQFEPIPQSPEVPIQQTSTTQAPVSAREKSVAL